MPKVNGDFSWYSLLNLLRELSFDESLPDPFVQNIVNLPTDVIPDIMQHLSFEQSYIIAKAIKEQDQPLNPLDRTSLNPLRYHDARLDNQTAIKLWLRQPLNKKKISHLHSLLENPTVDMLRFRPRILLNAASLGDIKTIQEMFNGSMKWYGAIIFRSACLSNNLNLLKYLIDTQKLKPNKWDLKNAIAGGNHDVIEFLVKNYGLDRFGWGRTGQYKKQRRIPRRTQTIQNPMIRI